MTKSLHLIGEKSRGIRTKLPGAHVRPSEYLETRTWHIAEEKRLERVTIIDTPIFRIRTFIGYNTNTRVTNDLEHERQRV